MWRQLIELEVAVSEARLGAEAWGQQTIGELQLVSAVGVRAGNPDWDEAAGEWTGTEDGLGDQAWRELESDGDGWTGWTQPDPGRTGNRKLDPGEEPAGWLENLSWAWMAFRLA